MGINGLLSVVSSSITKCHISKFKGKRAAIDGFVWLHRGCISCARLIARNEFTMGYINYFMKRVMFLIENGITPFIVFDGGDLPAKSGTNEKRKKDRAEHLRKAVEFEKRGLISEAEEHYKLAIEITSKILVPLYSVLRQQSIDFIVSPYEADAQLSYLVLHSFCDFVITEDSDLIPYQCPQTVFKLDSAGNCELLVYSDLKQSEAFHGFSAQMIIECCVLSGCDYLPSLPRIGIKTAIKLVSKFRNGSAAISFIRSKNQFEVPEEYIKDFEQAVRVFYEQKVFDPKNYEMIPIFESGKCEIAGSLIPKSDSILIAKGMMDPRSRVKYSPDHSNENVIQPAQYNIQIKHSAKSQFKTLIPSTTHTSHTRTCLPPSQNTRVAFKFPSQRMGFNRDTVDK